MRTLLRRGVGLLAVLAGLGLGGSAVHAQAPSGSAPRKMYTNKMRFRLPFNLDERERQRLREIQLYVRYNAESWTMKETAPPTQKAFTFKAPQDGEYSFSIVTVDKGGRPTPADVTKEPPALVVVVDTQRPEVEVAPAQQGGEECARCTVRDANPDPSTVRMEYQASDKSWRPCEPVPGSPELFRLPERSSWTGQLRATATDRADNTGTRELTWSGAAPDATAGGHGDARVEKVSGGPELVPPPWPSLPAPPALPAAGPVRPPARWAPAPTPVPAPAPVPVPAPAQPVLFSAKYVPAAAEGRAEQALLAPAPNSLRRQEPAVALEWTGPAAARVGQPTDYGLVVRNTCPIPVQQVLVHVRVPAGISVASTEPRAPTEGDLIAWDLGTLAPRQENNLRLKLVAQAKGDLTPQAWVTFTGSSVMHVLVREPRLHLVAVAPVESLQIGDAAKFVLNVSNPGDGPAEQVKVHAVLSDGLEHASGGHVDFDIGNLAPGEARTVQLIGAARAGGGQTCEACAEAEGGLQAQAQAAVTVSMPRLDLQVSGPGLRYLDRKAVYTFTARNPGDAPADNVVVNDIIPEGLTFVSATEGGRHDPASRTVSWFLGELGPGQAREVKLEVLAAGPGALRQHVVARAARGLKAEGAVLTRVECVSAMAVDITPTDDPVAVGEDTTYEVKVTNTGSKPETDVRVVCTLPDTMEVKDVQAPVGSRAEGRSLAFDPVPELAPRAEVVYRLQCKALAAGDVRFQAQASSAALAQPLVEVRPTHVYANTPALGAK
jgi:uncharacterized repeat protein (TIGR01451 family)